MRNVLDRFSVDLDFDLLSPDDTPPVQEHLERTFAKLGLKIKDQSTQVPQYFLRYESTKGRRNTIAIDVTCPPPVSNEYETVRLADIDRFVPCQTIATMVANKLVTPLDRFAKNGTIAGRDIYDIRHFLFQGLPWRAEVIEERTGGSVAQHFAALHDFVAKRVTQTVIDQDINTLLPSEQFRQIRTSLKEETLRLLKEHIGATRM